MSAACSARRSPTRATGIRNCRPDDAARFDPPDRRPGVILAHPLGAAPSARAHRPAWTDHHPLRRGCADRRRPHSRSPTSVLATDDSYTDDPGRLRAGAVLRPERRGKALAPSFERHDAGVRMSGGLVDQRSGARRRPSTTRHSLSIRPAWSALTMAYPIHSRLPTFADRSAYRIRRAQAISSSRHRSPLRRSGQSHPGCAARLRSCRHDLTSGAGRDAGRTDHSTATSRGAWRQVAATPARTRKPASPRDP